MPTRRSGKGCGNGGTVHEDMTELDPREGGSGIDDMLGEDEADEAVRLDVGPGTLASPGLVSGCLELPPDEVKMALNMAQQSDGCVRWKHQLAYG
ncbi:nucleolar protein 14 [Pseudozyma hubeiensis SY62]|uniref:Nucleolar protein 14 n=1 Tax=Pseudozyma hubeiensis (strain SY62) TaxID=1305764 RepID=R9NVU4_PSEHS|nr:nucleolar protein 14 [Pseudozyma hubeiensis SY62]GAC92537.1 nucleolar protein 14 [Pseudozyma hubeiensis SY62]